ncbi:MAG: hypothetical protein MZV64_17815 [Ignavibacteriales bacterium]|nr:hypothetical protein [Ignavibacteriales bacterium]
MRSSLRALLPATPSWRGMTCCIWAISPPTNSTTPTQPRSASWMRFRRNTATTRSLPGWWMQRSHAYSRKNSACTRTRAIESVVPVEDGLADIGDASQVSFDIARNAATLISPDPQELNTLLPAPPTTSDRIVFLTDVSRYKQCSVCAEYDALPWIPSRERCCVYTVLTGAGRCSGAAPVRFRWAICGTCSMGRLRPILNLP